MELSVEPPCQYITWKVRDFLQLPSRMHYSLDSPKIHFAGNSYCLRLYPNESWHNQTTIPGIEIHLVKLTSNFPERNASCKVGYRRKNEKGDEYDVYFSLSTLSICLYIPRSGLDENSDQWFADGTFTMLCSMRQRELCGSGSLKSDEIETSDAQEQQEELADILTGEFRICLQRSDVEGNTGKYVPEGILSVICSMHLKESCGSGSPQPEETETSEAEEEQEGLAAVSKLQSDYRQLLQKGARSDACLVVSGKEFRAHRCVLCARSDVFEAMFSHETAENESGREVINDLDPESFGEFLEYLYTGSVGAGLSDDNAFGLYAAANKYDVPTLKSECVLHILRNLSVDSFCDVMILTLQHGEEHLLQRAIEFFKGNLSRIILTVKWQQFMAYNSTSANELLIKALAPGEH